MFKQITEVFSFIFGVQQRIESNLRQTEKLIAKVERLDDRVTGVALG